MKRDVEDEGSRTVLKEPGTANKMIKIVNMTKRYIYECEYLKDLPTV